MTKSEQNRNLWHACICCVDCSDKIIYFISDLEHDTVKLFCKQAKAIINSDTGIAS